MTMTMTTMMTLRITMSSIYSYTAQGIMPISLAWETINTHGFVFQREQPEDRMMRALSALVPYLEYLSTMLQRGRERNKLNLGSYKSTPRYSGIIN